MKNFVAVDLGASSGRVITASITDGKLKSTNEITRFRNGPICVPSIGKNNFFWPILRIWEHICVSLKNLCEMPIESIGVDTWAVDYALLGPEGGLITPPFSYRDSRTQDIPEIVYSRYSATDIYTHNGLQNIDINTIFQLLAAAGSRDYRSVVEKAESVLLLPDLVNYWLTGKKYAEITNASSTGFVNPRTRSWSGKMTDIYEEISGVDISAKLPELIEPGTWIGVVRNEICDLRTQNGETTSVVAVGSHDTASAVAAVPAEEHKNFAFISCGTWSLAGLELDSPILSEESKQANFTNELGVDGTIRYLKNIMGMWIFNGCVNQWKKTDPGLSIAQVVSLATSAAPFRTIIDVNNPIFATPGDMIARIDSLAENSGQPRPRDIGEYARCVIESLALAHAKTIEQATRLAHKDIDVIHIVGGGSRNKLLCQLTADACGVPVVAGPTEATALGNILLQARTARSISDSLIALREVVRASTELTDYTPKNNQNVWQEARRRIF